MDDVKFPCSLCIIGMCDMVERETGKKCECGCHKSKQPTEMNALDKEKKEKQRFEKMSSQEIVNQFQFQQEWCNDMKERKLKGNEKYGNYMMEVDDKQAFEELREEMIDACNHLMMLTYKLNKVFVKKRSED